MKWLNWSTIINIQEQSPTSIDFSYFFPPSEKEKKNLNLSDASQENSPTFLALLVGTIIVYSFVYSLIFFCVEHGNKKFTIIIVYEQHGSKLTAMEPRRACLLFQNQKCLLVKALPTFIYHAIDLPLSYDHIFC